ncbi:MAG: DNA polymerase III subunit delta', partial [Clostridium sp.]|nr:DNA polymerase III subunit delta' [Clostridium sp.]
KILNKPSNKDYVDIISYKPKKASFGIDEVRSIITEVAKKPFESDKKVIIIHNGEKLTIQAQNAMLKTVEEPPKGVYIIILTESLQSILETIKSRCQVYKLTPLSNSEMTEFINRNLIDSTDNEKKLALSYSKGIPGRAIDVIKNEQVKKLRNILLELLSDLKDDRSSVVLKYEEKLNEFKDDKEEMLNIIISLVRDILVYRETRNKHKIINIDKLESIDILTEQLSYNHLISILNYIEKTRINFKNNANYSMAINVMLMGFMEGK